MNHFLDRAIAAAGAEIIVPGAETLETLEVMTKKPNDFVSEIDRASERAIIAVLRAAFPDHAIMAEESGRSGTSEYTWIIDPLDGTTNFLHGLPHHCISIALRQGSEVVVGVILESMHDRLFTAVKGGGAFLNGRPMHVSARQSFQHSLIGTGLPFTDFSYLDDYLGTLREIMQQATGIRRAGAAALDLAFVAASWLDGYWETGLNAWDIAAGVLLVAEAGGTVSDFAGRPHDLVRRHICAGTPGVHRAILDVLGRYPGLDT
jgi:myo-inositol-1(or 4)-monophosphatase